MIYFEKISVPTLKGTFNSNLFIVSAIDDSSAPDDNNCNGFLKSTVYNKQLCKSSARLFYKEIRTDTGYSAIKNAHVLRDATAELAFLRQASGCEFIIQLAAEIDLGVSGLGLVLELAHCNFHELYMKTDASGIARVISLKLFGGRDNYVNFLRVFEGFLTNVAAFLKQRALVYCDWKFENILCFHQNVNELRDLRFKLSDFGSVLTADTPMLNPNNINQLYSSPTFAKANKEIIPTHHDDCVSICYMFYKLNCKQFPWEQDYNLSPAPTQDDIDFILVFTAFLKTCPLFKLKTTSSDMIYWPSGDIFSALEQIDNGQAGVYHANGEANAILLPKKRAICAVRQKRKAV